MPNTFDHVLFAVLLAIFPLWAMTYGFRRLKAATDEQIPRVRLSVYRWAMALQWSLATIVAVLWITEHRPLAEIGLIPRLTFGLIGVGSGLLIVVPMILRQRRRAMEDEEAMDALRHRMARLERMLPHTRDELTLFSLLSITAGICEELLYRGYLIWYLTHWLGLLPAAGVAAVIFGLGHAYQGWRGMLLTGAVGAFLAGVYLVSGSLLAPMVIHAFMDIHSGQLAYAAYARERERSFEALDPKDERIPDVPS